VLFGEVRSLRIWETRGCKPKLCLVNRFRFVRHDCIAEGSKVNVCVDIQHRTGDKVY
jgi:hypothetical protein